MQVATFEKEADVFQGRSYRQHLDRNWQSGNKKLEAQDKRMADMGNIKYEGSNEVTQARVGVDGTNHSTLTGRLDDNELEVQNARGTYQNLNLREANQDNQIQNNAASILINNQKAQSATEIAKAAASGAPRGTFKSISYLKAKYPDGAKGIYTTKDNGHWWYYANGGWQDGGIYQSAGLADGTIKNMSFSTDVKGNTLNTNGGLLSINWETGYIANKYTASLNGKKEGEIVGNPNYSLSQYIMVHAGDLISVYAFADVKVSLVSLWDWNGEYVQDLKDGITGTERAVVKIPRSGFIRISNYNAGLDDDSVRVERYPQIVKTALSDEVSSAIDWPVLSMIWSPKTYVGASTNKNYPHAIAQQYDFPDSFTMSNLFLVKAGTLVTVKAGISIRACVLAEFASDGVTFINELVTGTNYTGIFKYYLDHDAYLRVSNDTTAEMNPMVTTCRPTLPQSPLLGKKINMLGDSYVKNGNDPVEEAWHYKLAQKYGMTYRNYGINGNGIVSTKANRTPMVDRFDEMDNDADYVVVIGGRNDYNHELPLDEFRTGFIKLLKGLVAKYTTAKICVFTPWSIGDIDEVKDVKLKDYVQTMVDVCEFYGIACFDASRKSSMTPWDADFRDRYYQEPGDTNHLNDAGHDRFLPKAEAFMNRL